MPSRAHMMLPLRAPVLFTSSLEKPLYIWPSTKTWQRASMWEVAIPWKATPTKSMVTSASKPGIRQSSPPWIIM